jgi:hypothetical protein
MPEKNHEDRTQQIALALAERREIARIMLRREMDARGLTEKAGWKIDEQLRNVVGGTELVLRPIHMREHAPGDLVYVVAISEEDGSANLQR